MLACLVLLASLSLPFSAFGRETEPSDPGLRDYMSANGLLNRGMNDLAIAEYRKFLTQHPNHQKAPLGRYGLAVALFRTKVYAEAIGELEKIPNLGQFEFGAEAQLILGQSRFHQQEFAKAAQAWQSMLNSHPEHDLADDAAALLAEAQYRAGNHGAVQPPVDLLLSRWPESPLCERAEFFSGLSKMAQNDFAGAAAVFTGMQQRHPQGQFAQQVNLLAAQALHRSNSGDEALKQYEAAIKQGSGDTVADAMLGLATLLQQREKNQEAGAVLDQLLERFPSHRVTAQALILRGRTWFELNEFDKALNNFSKAAAVDGAPGDQTAYWMAKCELRKGEFAPAADRLAKALQDHPKSELAAEMLYDRAAALMRAGSADGAAEAFASFRSKHPKHALVPDAIYLHAMIDHEQRRFAASLQLCKVFESQFANHSLAPAIAFLGAENDYLEDRLPQATQKYRDFIAAHPKDEQVSKAVFRLGSALYRQQNLDEAAKQLVQVVDGSKTPEAYRRGLYMLGDISFQQSNWAQAIVRFTEFLSFGVEQPSSDDALLKLALSLGRENRSSDAIAAYDALIEKFPKSVHRLHAVFERGQILLAQNDHQGAAQAFEQVLAEGKDSRFVPHALNHLASIAMQRNDFDVASELYQRLAGSGAEDLKAHAMFQRGQSLMAAGKFQLAAEALAAFVKAHPNDARLGQALAQQAIATARQGEEEKALALIANLQGEHINKLAPDLAAALMYEKAWCLRELDRDEDAAAAYRELLAAHERQAISVHALLELSEIESAALRHKEAAQLLTRLRERAGSAESDVPAEVKEPALYRLAVCAFELDQFEQCAALCAEFIREFPKSPFIASAHSFCGEALFKAEKPQQAAEHFQIVAAQYADDPSCSASMLRLGESYAALGKWTDSQQTFEAFLKKYPESEFWFQAHFGRAFALENQGRHDDAVAAYRSVTDRHSGPTAARSQFQIGECLFAKKQYDDAVRELLKVDILYGYPEWSAAALYEAGRCFESLARPAEARAQFEQVQEKYPESRWAKMAAQRLAAISNVPAGATSGG